MTNHVLRHRSDAASTRSRCLDRLRPPAEAPPPAACRPKVRPPISLVALALIAVCASCENRSAESPAGSPTPNLTAPLRANAVTSPGDPVDPEPTATHQISADDVEPDDVQHDGMTSSDANPLGGCVGCHVDVEDDLEGSRHLVEKIGCVECHGPSDAHVRDENNEAKPDQVFARKDVDRLCVECHECSRPAAAEPATEPPAERKVCTDCHQAHSFAPAPSGQH